ncbi:MAG: RNA polymerase sigma factor, partial [Chloroflexota bacterium]
SMVRERPDGLPDTGVPMQRDLVVRAMAGERDAFAELQRGSIDRLYTIARLILGDSDQAQDTTQEALIAAWRNLKGLRDPDKFEPWLRRSGGALIAAPTPA